MNEKIKEFLKEGRVAFFLGAGISMIPPSCLPSWWQINHAILDSLADEGAEIVPELRDLAEMIKKREEEGRLPPEFVAEIITNRIGKSYFEVLQVLEGDTPNLAHLWLAILAKAGLLKAIITTNFDTLIEKAFEKIGVPLKVLVNSREYENIEKFEDSKEPCMLLKLHGTATLPDTCIDTLAQRKRGLHPNITQALDYIGTRTFWIFLGYSGADLEAEPNYLGIRHRMNNSPGFAWLHLPERDPLPVISELANLYGANRGLIEHGVLPDWLDECKNILPENVQAPKSIILAGEKIQQIKNEKSEYIQEHALSWAKKQGSAECALILCDIGVDSGFYDIARSILLKLHEGVGEFTLTPIGNALVCQLLGEISRRFGEMEKTLKYHQDAAKYFQEANNLEGYHASAQDIANLKWQFGYFEEAEKDLYNIMEYHQKVNDNEGHVHALLDLSNLYRETDQYQKAMNLLNDAIKIAAKNGLEILRAHGILGKALIESELGEMEDAENLVLESIDIYTRLGDDNFLSEASRELSQIHFKRGEIQEALDILEKSRQSAILVGNKSRIIRAERVKGEYLLKLGEYNEAVSVLNNSLKKANELGDFILIITIMQSLGLAHQSQGNVNEAKSIYQEAINKAEKNGLDVKAAGIKTNLGIILEQSGEVENALHNYEEADKVFKRMGILESIAGSQGNLGNIHFRLGNYAEAQKYYEESMKIAEKLQNIDVVLRTKYNIANVVLQSGDMEGAKMQYQQAIDLAKKYEQKGLKDMFQINYAGLLFQLEDYHPALELYGNAYVSCIERKDYLQAGTAIYYAGLSYFRLNEVQKGIKLLEEAIDTWKMLDEEPPQLAEAQQTLNSVREQLNS
ncbi:MAG: tetratricopeptide repeat protein [Promethearchaeota archaeon]